MLTLPRPVRGKGVALFDIRLCRRIESGPAAPAILVATTGRYTVEAYGYNLDCADAFATFSAADYHWQSLYRHLPQFEEWRTVPEPQRFFLSRKLLRDIPHIAAWHFHSRFAIFGDIVLRKI